MIPLSDFGLLPIDDTISTPYYDGNYKLFTDRYWEAFQGKLMFYQGKIPQCNSDRAIMIKGKHKELPTEIVFLEKVWIPTDSEGNILILNPTGEDFDVPTDQEEIESAYACDEDFCYDDDQGAD